MQVTTPSDPEAWRTLNAHVTALEAALIPAGVREKAAKAEQTLAEAKRLRLYAQGIRATADGTNERARQRQWDRLARTF